MKPQIDETKYYTIGTENGEVLEVADTSLENGGKVQLYNDWLGRPRPWQLWRFEKASDYDDYRIINKLSGKALDVINQSPDAGSWLHQWDKNDAYSQVWFVQPTEDGYYKFLNVPKGKVLDIVGMVPEDFARLQIWDDVNGQNQKWVIREVNPETYETVRLVPETEKPEESPAQTDFVAQVEDMKPEKDTVFTFSEVIEPGQEEASEIEVSSPTVVPQEMAAVTMEEKTGEVKAEVPKKKLTVLKAKKVEKKEPAEPVVTEDKASEAPKKTVAAKPSEPKKQPADKTAAKAPAKEAQAKTAAKTPAKEAPAKAAKAATVKVPSKEPEKAEPAKTAAEKKTAAAPRKKASTTAARRKTTRKKR